MLPSLRPSLLRPLLFAAALLASGCPDDEVSHTRIIHDPTPPAAAVAPSAQTSAPPLAPQGAAQAAPQAAPMLPAPSGEPPSADAPRGMAGGPRRMADAPRGMEGEVAPPPKPVGPGQLSWTLPTGWSQTLTSGMRYATLTPAGGTAGVDVSVVVLAGSAGGEPANVNRWRSQIGLPPLSDDALAAVRKTFTTKVGPVSFYDFVSEGTKKSRVVAAIAQSQDNTWFFKMTGSAEAVDPAVGSFTELVKSLRSSAN